jgi:hypothetical protein
MKYCVERIEFKKTLGEQQIWIVRSGTLIDYYCQWEKRRLVTIYKRWFRWYGIFECYENEVFH